MEAGVERVRTWWRDSPRRQLIALHPAAGRAVMVTLVVLVVVSPVLSLVLTVAGGELVGAVPPAVQDGLGSAGGRRLVTLLVVLGVAFVTSYAAGGARGVLAWVAAKRIDRHLKGRILDATLGPPGVAHLEDPDVLDKVAITRAEETGMTPGIAFGGGVTVAVNRLAVLPSIGLLASFRWWLPLGVGAALVWMRRVMRAHILTSVNAHISESATLRRAGYFVDLALRPAAAKETRVFGLGPWLGERYRAHYLAAMAVVWRNRARGQRLLAAPLLSVLLVTVGGYVVIARAATGGELDLARLTILLTAMGGMRGILSLGNEDVMLEQGVAILPTFIEVEALMAARREAIDGDLPAAGLPARSVRFEGVGFRYPGSDHDVYAGLDLEITAGRSLAVVGVNGAGKTTLVKLLARLHDPTEGRITVDGTPLCALDPDAWQRRVAAIFQDFTHYELSAHDNVAFGALELAGDREALRTAAEQAGALDIIDALPGGWDTVLSRRFTGGADLSGGEWQRVALARALLAVQGGAGILVLDEPTANLDVRAEAELYDRFLELTRGVTTIVISHRFSTVRRADRIVVLDGGRVTEDGTHDELMALAGSYARMFELQAARFRDAAPQAADDIAVEVAGA